MKLQFENNEYYLMKDGEDLAIATTDESFINELGAERLSRKNCEAVFNDYDLDELVYKEFQKFDQEARIVYRRQLQESLAAMFNKALEILSDKKFSDEDLLKAFHQNPAQTNRPFKEFIQSLQQTEWDVEIETIEYGLGNDENGRPAFETRNLLDENACLILKRK